MKTKEKEVLKTKNSSAIMKVDPQNLILRDDFNVRRDMGDLNALMQSILSSGLQVPIKAKKVAGTDQYEVVDGHRRMSAILMAIEQGHEVLYVDVMTFSGNDEEQVMSMLVTGTGQKPLTEIEQAEAIKRLTGFGHRVEDIAKKMGKSLPHVYYLVKLSNLPTKVKNLIAEGYISGLAVMEIIEGEPNEELQIAMIEMAIEDAQKDAKEGEIKKATKKNIEKNKKLKHSRLFKRG
jgi:ParB family chromosome partitioning protein